MRERSTRTKRGILRAAAACLAALLGAGILGGCAGEDGAETRVIFERDFGPDEVFRIETETCSRAEVMIYLTTMQNQYGNVFGEGIWNTSLNGVTLEENVKEIVLARLAQIKTMCLLARDQDVTLTKSQEALVVKAAQEYEQSLSDRERELLGADLETVEGMYREYALAEQVYRTIIRDINPEISDDEARTIRIQHILIQTAWLGADGQPVPVSDADRKAAWEKANEIRNMALAGEDFVQLASRYSDDPTLTYSVRKGEMAPGFEAAAFALERDEISQVVETDSGFHIIRCVSTFDRAETDANKLEIVEQRKKDAFSQVYNQFVGTLARALNEDLWEEITLVLDEDVNTTEFFEIYNRYFK